MSNLKPNPRIVKALRTIAAPEQSTKTLRLHQDVNDGLDALKGQVGGSKEELANRLLRAALFTDALSRVLAVEQTWEKGGLWKQD